MKGLVKNEPIVVLADVDLSHIDFFQQVLDQGGFWLRSVATPQKLVTILEQHPVNILVVDIDYPFESGKSIQKEIRDIRLLPTCKNTRIVITSSKHSPEKKQAAYQAGACDYISYPIYPGELFLKMNTHLIAGARKSVTGALSRSVSVLSETNLALYPVMATASSCTQMLRQTSLSNKQSLYVDSLNRSLKRAAVIADNLRDFEEISNDFLALDNTPFDLDQLLKGLRDYLIGEAESRSVELLFNVPLEVPRSLIGDPDRLRRVLLNIISEAIIVGEGRPIILSILTKELGENSATFEIAINQKVTDDDDMFDDLEELSERISMAKSEMDESINLFVASCLIEMMGGTIYQDIDEREPGVYFDIEIQLAQALSEKSFAVPVDLRELRVLIVDDNPSSIAVHQAIIESLGFKVHAADNVDKAFLVIQEKLDTEPFDLILLDWHMPGKKGFHLLERLHNELSAEAHPLVIVISAYDKSKIDSESGRGKISGYLHKPISASVMFDTIMDVMGQNLPKTHRRILDAKRGLSGVTVNGSGRRILVVDDMPINQQIAKEVLISNDFQVEFAASGKEAVAKVTPAPELYDAILMDLEMPEMNGLEATRVIRQAVDRELLPIFAVTAHTMERDRQRCIEAGMNDHISKPLDADTLLQKLAAYLGLAVTSVVPSDTDEGQGDEEYEYVDIKDGIKRVIGNETLYFKLLSDFVHQARSQENEIYRLIDEGKFGQAAESAHTIAGSAGNLSITVLRRSAKQLQNTLMSLDDHANVLARFKRDMNNAIREIGEILLNRGNTTLPTHLLKPLVGRSEKRQQLSSLENPEFLKRLLVFRNQIKSQELIAIDTYYQLLVDYCDLASSLKPVGNKLIELEYTQALTVLNIFMTENDLDDAVLTQGASSHEG